MTTVRRINIAIGALAAAIAVTAALAGASVAGGATRATATIVNADGVEVGWAKLVEDGSRIVHVNVHVKGLTPGLHGIHIHSIGLCSPTFAAAGGHYNPLTRTHGLASPGGAHAGDLPNLIVNADGVGHLDATTDRVTLTDGPTTLFDATANAAGSSFIIHANEDDQVTDATNGGSGGRIACGVIVAG
jgi:Cu-Zn family superoxide dismutase